MPCGGGLRWRIFYLLWAPPSRASSTFLRNYPLVCESYIQTEIEALRAS
jgi:hypothetical protein